MIKRLFRFLGRLLLFFLILSVGSVFALKYIPVYFTPLMIIRAVRPAGTDAQAEAQRHWSHDWVSLDEISPWLPKAVVQSEDGHFYEHSGFDLKEIQNALDESARGRRQRGASTISQQTAKNVFLWPGHSWVRKGLEAYFTVLIELLWSKERIMEVYLNSIEMGPGIYGAEAAAQHYFHTSAARLSKRQSALIAVSLPSPLKFNPARPSAYMNRRAAKIMNWM